MSQLVECLKCGGLRRAETACCPHCCQAVPHWRKWLARAFAFAGPLLVACGVQPFPTTAHAAYGIGALPDGGDGGNKYVGVDAYGAVCLPGSTAPYCPQPDGGDAGTDGG